MAWKTFVVVAVKRATAPPDARSFGSTAMVVTQAHAFAGQHTSRCSQGLWLPWIELSTPASSHLHPPEAQRVYGAACTSQVPAPSRSQHVGYGPSGGVATGGNAVPLTADDIHIFQAAGSGGWWGNAAAGSRNRKAQVYIGDTELVRLPLKRPGRTPATCL